MFLNGIIFDICVIIKVKIKVLSYSLHSVILLSPLHTWPQIIPDSILIPYEAYSLAAYLCRERESYLFNKQTSIAFKKRLLKIHICYIKTFILANRNPGHTHFMHTWQGREKLSICHLWMLHYQLITNSVGMGIAQHDCVLKAQSHWGYDQLPTTTTKMVADHQRPSETMRTK